MSTRPSTRRVELGRGATLFTETDRALPVVTFALSVPGGTSLATPDEEGLARFALRLARRGAGPLDAGALDAELDRLGGELAVDVSASSIGLTGQVLARNLEPFVALVVRVLAEPTLSPDEAGRLQREALAELEEVKDNDRALAQIAFRRAVFGTHPYARGAAGRRATLATFDADRARAWLTKSLVRSGAFVGFSGDLEPETAERLGNVVADALRDAPAAVRVDPPEPAVPARRLVLVDKPERTQTQLLVGGLGTHPRDEDHVALSVAVAAFGGTFTSRFVKEVRSKRGWSYGASTRLSIERRRHAFSMWTHPSMTDAAACLELELDLLAGFVKDGVSSRELGKVKSFLVNSHAFDVDTASKRLHQQLDVELLGLPDDYYEAFPAHVRAVTLEAANAAVPARLDPAHTVVAVVGMRDPLEAELRAKFPDLPLEVVDHAELLG